MATWDDVRRLALALPETAERASRDGLAAWDVRDKTFAWERPLRPADRKALGPAASTRRPPPTWRSCWSRPGSAGRPSAWPRSTWTGPRW